MTDLASKALEFLQNNQKKRFKTSQLGKLFGVTTREMRSVLDGMDLKSHSDCRERFWWFESVTDVEKVATKPLAHLVERPKLDNRAMSIAMDRCRELYPNGGNFKSIS